MGIEEKLGGMKHFDDYYKHLQAEDRATNANNAIAAISKFEDKIDDFYTAVIKPAHDEFSKVLDAELAKIKGSTKGKEKQLKKAFTAALKAFFKKAMPSALKGLEDVTDEDEQYRILTHVYDTFMVGAGNESVLRGMANSYSTRDIDINRLRREMDQKVSDLKMMNRGYAIEHYKGVTLGTVNPADIRTTVEGKLKKAGWEIDNAGIWHAQDKSGYYQALKGMTKGEWGVARDGKTPLNPKAHYGLKKSSE